MIPAWYLHFLDFAVFWIAFWQTLFVVAYARAPWFRSPIGRALMLKGAALAAIFDIACLTRIFSEVYPGRFVVGTVVFSLVCLGSAYQCVVVIRTQWQSRRERNNGDPLATRDANHA